MTSTESANIRLIHRASGRVHLGRAVGEMADQTAGWELACGPTFPLQSLVVATTNDIITCPKCNGAHYLAVVTAERELTIEDQNAIAKLLGQS